MRWTRRARCSAGSSSSPRRSSVAEALKEVEGGVELVLCNVRFDDSRMFDFLGVPQRDAARQAPAGRVLPGSAQPRFPAGARRGIELALEALGVLAFLDMYEVETRDGPEAAQAALRATVMAQPAAGVITLVPHPQAPGARPCEVYARAAARTPQGMLALRYRNRG
jgi:hypothetical protein